MSHGFRMKRQNRRPKEQMQIAVYLLNLQTYIDAGYFKELVQGNRQKLEKYLFDMALEQLEFQNEVELLPLIHDYWDKAETVEDFIEWLFGEKSN